MALEMTDRSEKPCFLQQSMICTTYFSNYFCNKHIQIHLSLSFSLSSSPAFSLPPQHNRNANIIIHVNYWNFTSSFNILLVTPLENTASHLVEQVSFLLFYI